MSAERGRGGGGEEAAETKEKASYIPPILCQEILHRLPSNDLLNYKVVCKDWLRLISSTAFIQKHLERSKADCNDSIIVAPFLSRTEILDCANNTSKKIAGLADPDLLGSCDGLVLYFDHSLRKLVALNPCTGESITRIPNQSIIDDIENHRLICSWFGHHPSSSSYVLVLVNQFKGGSRQNADRIVFKVYSLSPNNISILSSSTAELHMHSNYSYKKIGTLLHGRLHCPAGCRIQILHDLLSESVILAYDFAMNEIVRMSPPPEDCCTVTNQMGVVDGCLCVVDVKTVWVMEVYGVKESWTKYATIEGSNYKGYEISRPFAFCRNGDVIVGDYKMLKLSRYCMREREIKNLKTYTGNTGFMASIGIACLDSLVSPTLLWKEEEEEEE